MRSLWNRALAWVARHLGLSFSISLVGWLLFLAALAFMLLPGCSSSAEFQQVDQQARNLAERRVMLAGADLVAGTMTPAQYAQTVRQAFDDLAADQQRNRDENGGSMLLELGISTAITALTGGALHMARNRSRQTLADELDERLAKLEKGGAS